MSRLSITLLFAIGLLTSATGYVASLHNNHVAMTGPTLPPPVDEN